MQMVSFQPDREFFYTAGFSGVSDLFRNILTLAAGEILEITGLGITSVFGTADQSGFMAFTKSNVAGTPQAIASMAIYCQASPAISTGYGFQWSPRAYPGIKLFGGTAGATIYLSTDIPTSSNNAVIGVLGTIYKQR